MSPYILPLQTPVVNRRHPPIGNFFQEFSVIGHLGRPQLLVSKRLLSNARVRETGLAKTLSTAIYCPSAAEVGQGIGGRWPT